MNGEELLTRVVEDDGEYLLFEDPVIMYRSISPNGMRLATQVAGALRDQPDNTQFLSPLGFNFSIKKLPNTNYFVQAVNVPTVQMGDAVLPTPFVNIPTIGDRMAFAEFQLSFKVDEDMKNYIELFDWMVQLGFPEDFAQSKNIYEKQRSVDFLADGPYSDATVTILNSAMQPNLEVQFEDCYPIGVNNGKRRSSGSD